MEPLDQIFVAAMVLVRITSMLLTAPVLGSRSVPVRFRLILGLALTILTFPLLQASHPVVPGVDHWLGAMFSEVTIGISLGLGVTLVYSAAQMAGTVLAQMASIPIHENGGFQNAASPVGQLFGILSAAAFTLMNGPEMLITTTLDTFACLPLGAALDTASMEQLLVDLCRQSFLLTLRGVAPGVAAMLISTLVIGMISRAYPQFNLLSLGISSNLLVLLMALLFTVGGCVWLFVDDFQQILVTIRTGLMGQGAAP